MKKQLLFLLLLSTQMLPMNNNSSCHNLDSGVIEKAADNFFEVDQKDVQVLEILFNNCVFNNCLPNTLAVICKISVSSTENMYYWFKKINSSKQDYFDQGQKKLKKL